MSDLKVKPCAVCLDGLQPVSSGPDGFRTDEGLFLECTNCHEVFGPFPTADDAIEDWNMRYKVDMGDLLYS